MYAKIINFMIQLEVGPYKNGGYTNDPVDPGGETKWGISKRANPDVDIKNLTREGAVEIYKRKYWKDEWEKLGLPLATCLMDTAVQGGNGPVTLEASGHNYVQYIQLRIVRYKDIITRKPSQQKYYDGWMNRMANLRRFIDDEKNQQG